MTPTWVVVGPMLMSDTTLTMKSMTSCQLSTPGGLVSLTLPEWSTTKHMSSRHAAAHVYHTTLEYNRFDNALYNNNNNNNNWSTTKHNK